MYENTSSLDASLLHGLLVYDPVGVLRWKRRPAYNAKAKAGDIAGGLKKKSGRWVIMINQISYCRASLVWLLHGNKLPDTPLDHANRNRSDDRIENLRVATYSEQNINRDLSSVNTSGMRNVYWEQKKRKWAVRLRVNGQSKRFGMFDDWDEARAVALRVSRDLHGEFWVPPVPATARVLCSDK